ncbi:MAG: PilZ domain-containing protein [Bacteriovoracales bacterium]|nr:PilZ domain-containing protein [Bacteriovoracales bacterium]
MAGKIIDFVQKRKESIEKKRRNFERIMFQNLLGHYSVVNRAGDLLPIEIVDISKRGMLFQILRMSHDEKEFEKNKELSLRLYFTKDSYLPVMVKVKHATPFIDQLGEGFMRYGCEFQQEHQSLRALEAFIDFIYKFAEHSSEDIDAEKAYSVP